MGVNFGSVATEVGGRLTFDGYAAWVFTLPRSFRNRVTAAAAMSAAACSTSIAPTDVVVRYYTPSQIIVPGGSVGRFTTANGCIYFDRAIKPSWRIAVLFPPGTRLSRDRRSVVLPSGQRIPFGVKLHISAERPTFGKRDETCGPYPLEILGVRED